MINFIREATRILSENNIVPSDINCGDLSLGSDYPYCSLRNEAFCFAYKNSSDIIKTWMYPPNECGFNAHNDILPFTINDLNGNKCVIS